MQSRLTGTPRTPPTAHSTCGHNADGAEWTYRMPRVPGPFGRVAVRAVTVTSFISGVRYAFPSGLDRSEVPDDTRVSCRPIVTHGTAERQCCGRARRRGSRRHPRPRDRKSTRLNSSHLVISYAVFCLKKKKLPALRLGP